MLYPRIADLHGYILTESIFVSLLCLVVGAIALSAHRPTWQWMAARGARLRPGDCGPAGRVKPVGGLAVAVLAHLEALRRATARAGCGGCRAHRPLPVG